MKNNEYVSKNPYLCKKDFYISELHMGDGGLNDITDYKGPYKTLKSAQNAFWKYVCKNKFLNNWDYSIRGKEYLINSIDGKSTYGTIWYSDGTLIKENFVPISLKKYN